MHHRLAAILLALFALTLPATAQSVRIKDLVEVDGVRSNDLVGYGLVVGLNGTGDGIRNAPKGMLLETDHDIARAATQIFLQAGVTHAMPPANVSYMEDDERRMIVEWYRNATNS